MCSTGLHHGATLEVMPAGFEPGVSRLKAWRANLTTPRHHVVGAAGFEPANLPDPNRALSPTELYSDAAPPVRLELT